MSVGEEVEKLLRKLLRAPLCKAEAEFLRVALATRPYLRYLFLRCDRPLRDAGWYAGLVLHAHAHGWEKQLQLGGQFLCLKDWALALCAHQYPHLKGPRAQLDGQGWNRVFHPWTPTQDKALVFEVRGGKGGTAQVLLDREDIQVHLHNALDREHGQVTLSWRTIKPHRVCRAFAQEAINFLQPKEHTCPQCRQVFTGVVANEKRCCVASIPP